MILLLIFFSLAMGVLAPLQTIKLRARADIDGHAVSFNGLFWVAMLSSASGLVVAFGVGCAVMFGPSYITGDFVGLPWLTMLLAIGASFWAGTKANSAVLSVLFARADEIAKSG